MHASKRPAGRQPRHAPGGHGLAVAIGLAAVLAGPPAAVQAYNLTPIYEETQVKLQSRAVPPFLRPVVARVLDQFSDPAHEALTARMFGCSGAFLDCGDNPEGSVPQGVLDGLRWNDNPIFRLASHSSYCPAAARPNYFLDLDSDPVCWATLFYDAEKHAGAKPGEHFSGAGAATPVALVYRVHFGDLQFIHGMASWDGETAATTQAHVLGWLELTWRLHDGEIADTSVPITTLVPALADVFEHNGFSPRSLFLPQLTEPGSDSEAILRNMALGSLIHTLEDSYSSAHARRDDSSAGHPCTGFPDAPVPGRITAFYAYNHQAGSKHKQRDSSDTAETQLSESVTVVELGREVLALAKQQRSWKEVAPWFGCVMEVSDPAATAGPGEFAP